MAKYVVDSASLIPIADEVRTIDGVTSGISLKEIASKLSSANSEIGSQVNLIAEIKEILDGKAGSGGFTSGSFILTADEMEYTIEHGLNKIPDFFAVYGLANSSSITGGIHYAIGYKEKYVFGLAGGSSIIGILGHFQSNTNFTLSALAFTDIAALYKANQTSITVTGEYSGAKIKAGVEYKWIAF